MQEAMKLLKPGVSLHEYHKEVGELMTKQLLDLKLIDNHDVAKQNPSWPAYKKYFMHGTSHFIGLDVHDVGLWHEPIAEGNVFTVEPGFTSEKENLGIRLENDIVIKKDGFHDLMSQIPLKADAIEDAMNPYKFHTLLTITHSQQENEIEAYDSLILSPNHNLFS